MAAPDRHLSIYLKGLRSGANGIVKTRDVTKKKLALDAMAATIFALQGSDDTYVYDKTSFFEIFHATRILNTSIEQIVALFNKLRPKLFLSELDTQRVRMFLRRLLEYSDVNKIIFFLNYLDLERLPRKIHQSLCDYLYDSVSTRLCRAKYLIDIGQATLLMKLLWDRGFQPGCDLPMHIIETLDDSSHVIELIRCICSFSSDDKRFVDTFTSWSIDRIFWATYFHASNDYSLMLNTLYDCDLTMSQHCFIEMFIRGVMCMDYRIDYARIATTHQPRFVAVLHRIAEAVDYIGILSKMTAQSVEFILRAELFHIWSEYCISDYVSSYHSVKLHGSSFDPVVLSLMHTLKKYSLFDDSYESILDRVSRTCERLY